ncbi:DUF3278 domain-containing protein [Macrococcoides caseolyticum]|uniref:DUF3278 domain-containing protein n=1 Tax=Macrococcoides caseolyticum TaxID=69966 RepID=UPI001F33EE0B|nr:DUF3278 domain-containing protein [Macrococcus caseolyticus]MCE4956595.1 DUF3278 domain-containing protein [Macrococcus caseolyticus]
MTLLDKVKPSFLGVEMDRDEYFRQEGNKIMAVSHVYSFFAIMILALVSFIWDITHNNLPVSSALLLIVSQIANIYFLNGSRNKNILSNEVYSPEEYKEKLIYYKNKSIKATVIWGSWMYVWTEIINPMLIGERYTFEWKTLFINIIGALFFGITIYLVMRHNLKKEFEESDLDD